MGESAAIPASVDGITPGWLTGVLRSGGHLPQGQVTGIETNLIGAGAGFIGSVGRLSLSCDGAPSSAPRTIIAKLPPAGPGSPGRDEP